MLPLSDIHRKWYKRRRHVNFIKSPGHGILASNGRQTKAHLRRISAQQSRKRLAPAGRFAAHSAEIFLESKPDMAKIPAAGHDPWQGFQHRIHRTVIWRPAGQIRIKSIWHHRHCICVARRHWKLRYHGLGFCKLVTSAVRHQYAAGANGAVKHFHKPFLWTYIQIPQCIQPCGPYIIVHQAPGHFFGLYAGKEALFFLWNFHGHLCLLMSAVRIEKRPGNVYNLFSTPYKHKPWFFRNRGYHNGLQVFLPRIGQKCVHVLPCNDAGHTLLGLWNRNLRSVQSGVFFRYPVQFYPQPVGQFPDSHRYPAGAKIVTFFYHETYFRPAEEPLDFALCRRITFLYLCAAGINGLGRMSFGWTGGAAAAVPSGASSQQHDQIPGIWGQPLHRRPWSRSQDSADLHPLCHIIRVIDFLYIPGGKPDLIAIGAVSGGSAANQLSLGQLALHGLAERSRRICCSRHPHGLIDIGPPGKRIADRAA